jgi:hypothetical protein
MMVGTRDPQETLSRTELDPYGNPPIQCLACSALARSVSGP